jgi:hypothetical protein
MIMACPPVSAVHTESKPGQSGAQVWISTYALAIHTNTDLGIVKIASRSVDLGVKALSG